MTKRRRFILFIKKRFLLRFHMSLILIATVLAGVMFSKVLLLIKAREMLIRYPLTVLFSYLAFFAFMRLWLWHMSSSCGRRDDHGDAADALDIVDIPGGGKGHSVFRAGGEGDFGGAGASGSFEPQAEVVVADSPVFDLAAEQTAESLDTAAEGIAEGGSAAGEAAAGLLEEGGLILIIFGAVMALVFGAGIYLVYQAPLVLSEAAFEFILASSLLRGARKAENPDWMHGVFKATAIPFVSVLIISILAAWSIHGLCPQADKLSEAFAMCYRK